jgi:GGDEF domain-containing protein
MNSWWFLGSLKASAEEAANQTEAVGEKILAALGQAYQLGDIDHRSSASIGATLFRGHDLGIDDFAEAGRSCNVQKPRNPDGTA